jgi:uncharacterized protein YPO0396
MKGDYSTALQGYTSRRDNAAAAYRTLVQQYDRDFNSFLPLEPAQNAEAETMLQRLVTSELPEYKEKIERARVDAEKEFKDHFIARLNEQIEGARLSFREINDILSTMQFGADQYRFSLEERPERRGQIEVIRKIAQVPKFDEGGLFDQFEGEEKRAADEIFNNILTLDLDSKEMRDICDYRTYFHYDIKIRETDTIDEKTGKAAELSLSKVLHEKSGGETQTPYYVAIAASFYRFYKARPEDAIRLVIFDEAFNRMDDERIGKILQFYNSLNLQIITSVPPEKIEAILPYMDRVNVITRFGNGVRVRTCSVDEIKNGVSNGVSNDGLAA